MKILTIRPSSFYINLTLNLDSMVTLKTKFYPKPRPMVPMKTKFNPKPRLHGYN